MGAREWSLLFLLSVLWGGSFFFFKVLLRMPASVARILAFSLTCFALAAHAQRPPPDFGKIEIKTTQIAPDFYTLEGLGGTVSAVDRT